MTIVERLTKVRKESGETQASFAKMLEVSPRAYASYELGERDLPSTFVQRLHKELGISPAWLLVGEGAQNTIIQSKNLVAAIIKVRAFAEEKNIEIEPHDEANLIGMITDFYNTGGPIDSPLVQKILESSR